MLKVKIKGKHLVAIALVFLLSIGVLYVSGPQILYKKANALSSEGKSAEAKTYYELTTKLFPYSDEGIRALFFSAQQDAGIYGNTGSLPGLIVIFPTSTGTEYTSTTLTKQAIDKFNLVRQRAPESPWAKHALREIGTAYYSLGDTENAIKYLKMSIAESHMRQVESTELLVRIYLEQGNADKALELVEKSLKEQPNQLPLEMMMLNGRALMALGKWAEAQQIFTKIPKRAELVYTDILKDEGTKAINNNIENWQNTAYAYIKKLETLSENKGMLGSISGKVNLGDKGIENSYVYLIDLSINEDYYTGNTRNLIKTQTDHEGRFVFSGLVPGNYALGVGIKAEKAQGYVLQNRNTTIQIKAGENVVHELKFVPIIKTTSPATDIELEDEIIFTWERVSNADSYSLFIGPVTRDETGRITGTYTTDLRSNIKNNKVEINIDKEITKSRFRQSIAYHDGAIDPFSLLGTLYYGGEYTWGVRAYDKAGNLLTSSTGYGFLLSSQELPLFKISQKKLSNGDKLVLEKKYDEAKKAYLQELENSRADKHALLMLARMNQFGTDRENRDLEAALSYYEQLFNVEPTTQVKKALADVYYDAGKINHAYEVYSSLLNTSEESWLIHFRMARIKFLQGETGEALNKFRQTVQMENGIYVRAHPTIVSLLLDDIKGAIWFAQIVDNGADYLHLLETYKAMGFVIKPAIKNEIATGNYKQALEIPSTTQHDFFIKGLLYYSTTNEVPRDKIDLILKDMEPGLLKELLQHLTI